MATVILKATEACNSRCIYCDVVRKKPRPPVNMPLETLELFFSRVNEFLTERPDEHIEIVWHGGEPLLLGPDYFWKAIEFQSKSCSRTHDRISHSIQSNLTLFSREFTEVMRRLGVDSFGTSYDPIENIRGLGARRDSETYNRRFMDALAMLEEEGFNWGIIYVVTKLSLAKPLEIFQFLSNLAPAGSFMFNPVLLYSDRVERLRISPEEYTDFLGAVFPAWWRNREELQQVEPFSSLTRTLLGEGQALMCCDSGTCARSHVNLLPDGSLSHCGRSADWGLLPYGSIFDKSFSQAFNDPQRDLLLERNLVLPTTDCKGCRFWAICHGGCPLDAWSASGSFLHKTNWCDAKKGFIEKYFEPLAHEESAQDTDESRKRSSKPRSSGPVRKRRTGGAPGKSEDDGGPVWVNPIGGLGDTLMMSGVLKQVADRDPLRKFNLVERTKYRQFFENHPAIEQIGFPPPGARFISTNYWDHENFQLPGARAYQVLARIFGLEVPVEERLYVPWEPEDDPVLMRLIAWGKKNVLVCQSSDSPKKQLGMEKWESLVGSLKNEGIGIVQAGKSRDRYIRGAYSLLGLTTPRQVMSLLRHFDAVVTADNFIMHGAFMHGVPAVILWGPTDHRVYGYSGQIHIQASPQCEHPRGCIGPGQGGRYHLECPKGAAHCMNSIDVEFATDAVLGILKRKRARENTPGPRESRR
jgi:uncharacterized protein